MSSQKLINESYGVLYTPSSVLADSPTPTIPALRSAGIRYIRVLWVELTNIIRVHVIPISHFEKVMKSTRPGFGIPGCLQGHVSSVLAEGYGATGEFLYVPDSRTMRICVYAPGHASVLGWLEEQDPYLGPEGKLIVKNPACARSKLRDIVADAGKMGVEFLVGIEIEFVLLVSTNPVRTANASNQSSGVNGLLTGLPETQVLEEIADALIQSGIRLEKYHAETAPGQYEITTEPLTPLEAADAAIHTRLTILNVAAKHGFRATFAPRISMTSTGNGFHAHISVHRTGYPKPKETLSDLESSFLAGVLDDLPAVAAFALPIPTSYKRVVDGAFTGGTYVSWGAENRECPIRLCNAKSPGSRNFEIRPIDGTANIYLALASVIGLGFAGIKSKRRLRVQNYSGTFGAASLTEKEREALGISQRMPLSWEEGRETLTRNEALNEILGKELIDTYLRVNTVLSKVLNLDDGDEQKTLTRLVEMF